MCESRVLAILPAGFVCNERKNVMTVVVVEFPGVFNQRNAAE